MGVKSHVWLMRNMFNVEITLTPYIKKYIYNNPMKICNDCALEQNRLHKEKSTMFTAHLHAYDMNQENLKPLTQILNK